MAQIQENIIQNAIPIESKEQGLAVLGTIVTNQAMTFAERMIPTLEKKIKDEVKARLSPSYILATNNNFRINR
jgi:Tfp pilus assembly pilus retraction ATPase PilT